MASSTLRAMVVLASLLVAARLMASSGAFVAPLSDRTHSDSHIMLRPSSAQQPAASPGIVVAVAGLAGLCLGAARRYSKRGTRIPRGEVDPLGPRMEVHISSLEAGLNKAFASLAKRSPVQDQISALQKEKGHLQSQVWILESERDDLDIDVSLLKVKCLNVEVERDGLSEKATALQFEISRLQDQISAVQKEKGQLEWQIQEDETEREELLRDLAVVLKLEFEAGELSEKVNALEGEKRQLQDEVSLSTSLQTELSALEQSWKDREAQLLAQLREAEEREKKLEQRCSRAETDQQETEKKRLQDALKYEAQEEAQLQAQGDLEEQMQDAFSSIANVRSSFQDQLQQLMLANQSLQAQVVEAERNNADILKMLEGVVVRVPSQRRKLAAATSVVLTPDGHASFAQPAQEGQSVQSHAY
mmetsp:Transcript_25651/g.66631  ORF Transcript_25651/g.66631 Transcript_25651/m.66631 type:complete len:418 (+) Transcript_25651:3-1256(+)